MIQGFERFSALVGKTSSALLDLYPLLRRLPDIVIPLRKHAKLLHEEACELHTGHWMKVKNGFKDGTATPSFCVDLARAQDEEGFSDQLAGYTVRSRFRHHIFHSCWL